MIPTSASYAAVCNGVVMAKGSKKAMERRVKDELAKLWLPDRGYHHGPAWCVAFDPSAAIGHVYERLVRPCVEPMTCSQQSINGGEVY